ncbi:MAG: hypothetical protein ACREJ2_15955 [Planctomycetota bacterium]
MHLLPLADEPGRALLADRDPAHRLALVAMLRATHAGPAAANPATAAAGLTLTEPAAGLLLAFLAAIDPHLGATVGGMKLVGAAEDLPVLALSPTPVKTNAGKLAQVNPFDLDHFLEHFAGDPPPDPAVCAAVREVLAQLTRFYQALAAQDLGMLALPD